MTELGPARWLLERGLAGSALLSLGRARGGVANDLRLRSSETPPPSKGVYFAATPDDAAAALALPAEVEIGRSPTTDPDARTAMRWALRQATLVLGVEWSHALRPIADNYVRLKGDSLGVAFHLAALSWLTGVSSDVPVFATGAVREDGTIACVDHVGLKCAAARRDLGTEAKLLVPAMGHVPAGAIPIATLAEARTIAFGASPLVLRRELRSLTEVIERTRKEPDHARALEQLHGLRLPERPADASLLVFEKALRLRHLGRVGEAETAMREANRLSTEAGRAVDSTGRARLEIELANTMLDAFDFDAPIRTLEAFVTGERDTGSGLNELYARGTLSLGLAIQGRFADAVRSRSELLDLHKGSEALAAELPQSLAMLAQTAGLARDAPTFDAAVADIVRLKSSATVEPGQEIYDTAAIVRGSVLLGRQRRVVEWFDDQAPLSGAASVRVVINRPTAVPQDPYYPNVSTLRAVVRALSLCGRTNDALALSRSVRATPDRCGPLVMWLAVLVGVEAAVATHRAGSPEADRLLADARQLLFSTQCAANRYHDKIVHGSWTDVEAELDRVYY